MYISLLRWI